MRHDQSPLSWTKAVSCNNRRRRCRKLATGRRSPAGRRNPVSNRRESRLPPNIRALPHHEDTGIQTFLVLGLARPRSAHASGNIASGEAFQEPLRRTPAALRPCRSFVLSLSTSEADAFMSTNRISVWSRSLHTELMLPLCANGGSSRWRPFCCCDSERARRLWFSSAILSFRWGDRVALVPPCAGVGLSAARTCPSLRDRRTRRRDRPFRRSARSRY